MQMKGGIQKPFLKWVGGKTQLLPSIIERIPNAIENYHEPFVGGGSVLLAVLSLKEAGEVEIRGTVYACDANASLIDVYQTIQSDKEELFQGICRLIKEYDGINGTTVVRRTARFEDALTSKESYYYWIRHQFNQKQGSRTERAAQFMFLNKTCFRGIYREGPNGFNVPYGHYKTTPVIIDRTDLDAISSLIKDVVFVHRDFAESIQAATYGDFVYLDPPYAPENATSFVGYTKDGFDEQTHLRLFRMIERLNTTHINFVLSNAKVDLVTNFFANYQCVELNARRAINSKKPGARTQEVLIYTTHTGGLVKA